MIDQSATVDITWLKDLGPKIGLTPLDEIPRLLLEHGVLVGDRNEFFVAETFRICDIGKVWIPLLAEFTNDQRLVKVVLFQERLRIVVAVDVDLGQGIVHGRILRVGLNPGL